MSISYQFYLNLERFLLRAIANKIIFQNGGHNTVVYVEFHIGFGYLELSTLCCACVYITFYTQSSWRTRSFVVVLLSICVCSVIQCVLSVLIGCVEVCVCVCVKSGYVFVCLYALYVLF